MIIPAVPLRNGLCCVPSTGDCVGAADDIVDKFSLCDDVVLYDLECGRNRDVVLTLLEKRKFRVYVGHLNKTDAVAFLDAGVSQLIIDDQNAVELLSHIPPNRVIIQFHVTHDMLQATNWATDLSTSLTQLTDSVACVVLKFPWDDSIKPPVAELQNVIVPALKQSCGLTIHCPLSLCQDVAVLHAIGVDIQVDSALLSNRIDLCDAIAAPLTSDRPDGYFPTIVTDEHGIALGLVYSSRESIREAVRTKRGVYQSRKRGLWYKGETTGDTQELRRIQIDCDADCLRFVVHQHGHGFCHLSQRSCFGSDAGIPALMRTLESRKRKAPEGSYTQKLFNDDSLLCSKLLEEAGELTEAEKTEDVAWEAADVIYFTLVKCAKAGVKLSDVEKILDHRALKVKRRKGDAKTPLIARTVEKGDIQKNNISTEKTFSISVEECDEISLRCYAIESLTERDRLRLCCRPAQSSPEAVFDLVNPILENVKRRGDKALLELTEKFDKVTLTSPVLTSQQVSEMVVELSDEVRSAIDLAWDNVYKFHYAQLQNTPLEVETAPGVICSRHVRPIEKVGLYIPGGTAILPSTAVMLGVPAKVAGCKEIVLATPPMSDGSISKEILYIAQKIGISLILLAGGAQAIAALAYGTDSVPKVDKICGPGNQFVTAAKLLVQNDMMHPVSIDMPAGPSEVMVIADGSANPVFVAADLLSQAEHGPDSQVVLVALSLSDKQLAMIVDQIYQQLNALPRRNVASTSIGKSFIVKVNSRKDALLFSNMYAPEHLIINTTDAASWLDEVNHAGSVFIGQYSPESCGDYASGTNHTLPTYGYARMYSGVSTTTFQKHITAQQLTAEGIQSIGDAVATLAAVEGLDAHRNAVLLRQGKIPEQ
ncbi:uncharacterized protein LOC134195265 isoform X2 [Corticium candelabrum]|uniref:uncharacterized protein LOC134195265 isoform X2 n=1 Tax=Corticium candelabrum TaxID=121492 RepID=UPI002E25AEA2|nr:uncharacterized protein LOC134195265 isoform X2 [Corticium candelabrum]